MGPIRFLDWSSAPGAAKIFSLLCLSRHGQAMEALPLHARRSGDLMEPNHAPLSAEASLEDLGLSVGTRNALKGVGCITVADVLGLSLDRPVRGLGKLAKEELLTKLELAGVPHPS